MAIEKMLHIVDPRHLLSARQTGAIDTKTYEKELHEYRLDVIDSLRVIFPGLTLKECGSLGSGGAFIPFIARNGTADELEDFLKETSVFPGVSVREVA